MLRPKSNQLVALIPAFKPRYLESLFFSLNAQTFKQFDVVVSDDSRDGSVTTKLEELDKRGFFEDLEVDVVPGPRIDASFNHHQLDQMCSPKYQFIHFLNDDDPLLPTFYEQHLAAHDSGDYSVSVSQRWFMDCDDRIYGRPTYPGYINTDDKQFTKLSGPDVVRSTVIRGYNWLGELGNMLFKGTGSALMPRPPETTNEMNFFGLPDLGTCLQRATDKPIVFISSFHSCFRVHSEQTSQNFPIVPLSKVKHVAWAIYAIHAWRSGWLDDQEYLNALASAKLHILEGALYDSELIELSSLISQMETIPNDDGSKLFQWWINYIAEAPSLREFIERINLELMGR